MGAFDPILGLAVMPRHVNPKLAWRSKCLLATRLAASVPFPFLGMVDLMLPQGRLALVCRTAFRALVLFLWTMRCSKVPLQRGLVSKDLAAALARKPLWWRMLVGDVSLQDTAGLCHVVALSTRILSVRPGHVD